MSDKVLVRISCREIVCYEQTVEMTREEWEHLKATPESKMEDGSMSPLSSWLDFNNPTDSRGFDDIELDVVDEEGNFVKPEDSWNPMQ